MVTGVIIRLMSTTSSAVIGILGRCPLLQLLLLIDLVLNMNMCVFDHSILGSSLTVLV